MPLCVYSFASSPSGYSQLTHTKEGYISLSPPTLSSRGSAIIQPMESGYEIWICGIGITPSLKPVICETDIRLGSDSNPISVGCVIPHSFDSRDAEAMKDVFHGIVVNPHDGIEVSIRLELITILDVSRCVVRIFQNHHEIFNQSVPAQHVFPAIMYDYKPFCPLSILLLSESVNVLSKAVSWYSLLHNEEPLCWQTTFVNRILQQDDSFSAQIDNRLLSTFNGYSFGHGDIWIYVGDEGIAGIGVCCRPGMSIWYEIMKYVRCIL